MMSLEKGEVGSLVCLLQGCIEQIRTRLGFIYDSSGAEKKFDVERGITINTWSIEMRDALSESNPYGEITMPVRLWDMPRSADNDICVHGTK